MRKYNYTLEYVGSYHGDIDVYKIYRDNRLIYSNIYVDDDDKTYIMLETHLEDNTMTFVKRPVVWDKIKIPAHRAYYVVKNYEIDDVEDLYDFLFNDLEKLLGAKYNF